MSHRCPKRCHRCPDMAGDVMPFCWGTVHSNDMRDCHCPRGADRIEQLEQRIERLERAVKAAGGEAVTDEDVAALRAENARLTAQLGPGKQEESARPDWRPADATLAPTPAMRRPRKGGHIGERVPPSGWPDLTRAHEHEIRAGARIPDTTYSVGLVRSLLREIDKLRQPPEETAGK